MMMPETDGKAFLSLAKKHQVLSAVPIIFFSAGTASAEDQKYLLKRSNGFIRKPFLAEDLFAAIEEAMKSVPK